MRVCKKCKTEFSDKEQKCPNCGQTFVTKTVKIGCSVIFIVIFLMIVIALISNAAKEPVSSEMSARSFARVYVQLQAREPLKAKATFNTTQRKIENDSYIFSGVLSAPNMMGGISNYDFAIQVQFDKSVQDNYKVMSCFIGDPY